MAEPDGLPGVWRDFGAGQELDLRGLEPPEPMVGILGRIEADPGRAPFIVRVPHDPVHLYGELVARGWRGEVLSLEEGNVRLRLASAQ